MPTYLSAYRPTNQPQLCDHLLPFVMDLLELPEVLTPQVFHKLLIFAELSQAQAAATGVSLERFLAFWKEEMGPFTAHGRIYNVGGW